MKEKKSRSDSEVLGGNVYLRPPTRGDLPFIKTLWTDPETMSDVGGPIEFTPEQWENWYEKMCARGGTLDNWKNAMIFPGKTGDFYCLIFNKDHQPVGEISFHKYNPETSQAHFNIKIYAPHRKQGYAKDAMELMLHYYFLRWGGKILIDDVATDNKKGLHACINFGFEVIEKNDEVTLLIMTYEKFLELYGNKMLV